ncbi:hypothetical protein PUW59_02700 [Lactobacillus mulieris]|nr:hypothetical protein PUW59_02700 [Lactobacillus mulieris]
MTKCKCKKCGFDATIEALLAIDCVIAIGMFFIGIILKKYGYILGLVGIIFQWVYFYGHKPKEPTDVKLGTNYER